MTDIAPQLFVYDAERSVMVPMRKTLADKTYTDRQTYRLGIVEERSANSHNHYFASVQEAWSNLPDDLAERFPTADHLRRHALIKAGYHDASEFVCKSHAEAVRLSAFVKGIDDYAVVIVKDNIVRRLTAKSQSYQAMGKRDFQDSKDKVLDVLSAMIGVQSAALKNAGMAA